jgi:hypothetical protein
MQSNFYSCHILINFKFYRKIFLKSSSIKFHENPSRGSRVVPSRRADGQTYIQIDRDTGMREANSQFPKFYEGAQKYKGRGERDLVGDCHY